MPGYTGVHIEGGISKVSDFGMGPDRSAPGRSKPVAKKARPIKSKVAAKLATQAAKPFKKPSPNPPAKQYVKGGNASARLNTSPKFLPDSKFNDPKARSKAGHKSTKQANKVTSALQRAYKPVKERLASKTLNLKKGSKK